MSIFTNQRENSLGGLESYINSLIHGGLSPMVNNLYDVSGRNLTQQQNRAVAQAGQLGAGRGYSMGFTNPFAYAQRAENDVYGQFAPQFGQLEQGRAGAQISSLMQLLGLQSGIAGQRSEGALGGLIGGLGELGGAIIPGLMAGGGGGRRAYNR